MATCTGRSRRAVANSIAINGTAVDANRAAFLWGRRAAVYPQKVAEIAGPLSGEHFVAQSLDELIRSRISHLTTYQDSSLAQRYQNRLASIRSIGNEALLRIVATQYARLLAPKDEYEVARLYAETDFLKHLGETFEGNFRLSFHLAPPLFSQPGPDGRPKKIAFGPWLMPVLKWLAKARKLRGSWLDPFRFGQDKQSERKLLADYEADLDLISETQGNMADALTLANWPGEVRGFGPVRAQAAEKAAKTRETARMALIA